MAERTQEPDSNQEIVPATEDVFGIQHGGTIDDDIMRRVALIPMLLQVLAESHTTIKRLQGITGGAPLGRFRTIEEQVKIRADYEAEKAAGWTGDPQPYLYADGCREETPAHLGDSPEHATVEFKPRTFKRYMEEEKPGHE